MDRYLLGIDVGTTGIKVLLLSESGRVAAGSMTEHGMSTPRPLWTEQRPENWWRGTVKGIKDVMRRAKIKGARIASIGVTGQMHGLVLLDKKGGVLRPCIMWNDQRAAPQCVEMIAKVGARRLIELTGNTVLPGFTAPKIEWVRQNERKVFERTAKFLLPKDYVRYRLTGVYMSDVSDASGTSLFDVKRREWSDEAVDAFCVQHDWLPEVTESIAVSSIVSARAAKETGLHEGTPVIGGAGDQAAQAVGSGVIGDGMASVTIGTSGVVFVASKEYVYERDGRLHAFCHAVPGMWHLMGVMLSAGGSLRWLRDALGNEEKERAKRTGKDPYYLLCKDAEKVPSGSEGLVFLPYLSGERTPHPDPEARGVFFGLTLRHTKAHMTRSVIEGVTFGLCDMMEIVRNTGLEVGEIRASGGGARSDLWLQVIADVFDKEIVKVNVEQGAAFGSALLAGVGADVFDSIRDACRRSIRVTSRIEPGEDVERYREYYERYRALYPLMKEEFARLSALAKRHHER